MSNLSDDLIEVFRDVAVNCVYKISNANLKLLNEAIDKARELECENCNLDEENDRLRQQITGFKSNREGGEK